MKTDFPARVQQRLAAASAAIPPPFPLMEPLVSQAGEECSMLWLQGRCEGHADHRPSTPSTSNGLREAREPPLGHQQQWEVSLVQGISLPSCKTLSRVTEALEAFWHY